MSDPYQPSPSDSRSAIAQDEQARRQHRYAVEVRQREERDRARQEETERRERQRIEEAQRRAAAQGERPQSSAPMPLPVVTPAIATATERIILQAGTDVEVQTGRTALIQTLANRAADETRAEAQSALLTVLAQRPAKPARAKPLSFAQPLPDLTFPAAWASGDTSLFNQQPTAWMEIAEVRTVVQHAAVEAWLEEREAAAMSGWRQVRVAVAIIVIVVLLIGAMTVLFSICSFSI